jgi:ABC-type transport system substrate-binding protein
MSGALRRLAVTLALVGPAAIGLTAGPAGAATPQARVSAASNASPPTVKLVGSGSSVTFDPSSLTVTKKNGGCSPAHGEWVVTNKTSVKQVVLFFGHKAFSLEPSESIDSCASSSGPGKIVLKFTLKSSPAAKLKVTVIVP